jgi:heat shock protein HslJ
MIRLSKTLAAALLITMPLIAPAGCSSAGNPLDGTQWKLTEWTISSIDPAHVTITATFADGRVSGNSGVNSYGGSYQVGPGDAFSVGQIAGTQMAGSELAMRAESAYLTLLGQAASYKLADAKLTLYDKGGNESLIFDASRD